MRCSSLLQKHIRGGLIVVGGVNLGGSIEPVYNAVSIAELAVDKQAQTLLMPVAAFYKDASDAVFKSLVE